MRVLFRVGLLVGSFAAAQAFAQVWPSLPVIDGQFSGLLSPFGPDGDLTIRWTVDAHTPSAQKRFIAVRAAGLGAELWATGELGTGSGRWLWCIEKATADVAALLPVLAPKLAWKIGDLTAAGGVTVSGRGEHGEGVFSGQLAARWTDGALRSAAQHWSVEGIALGLDFPEWPALTGAAGNSLTFREALVADVSLRGGRIDFGLEPDGGLRVSGASMRGFGGEVVIAPFQLRLDKLKTDAVRLAATFRGIELRELKPFLPDVVREIAGRVDGEGTIMLGGPRGFEVEQVRLRLMAGEKTTLRLSRAPGFLTARMAAKIEFLPGAFGRWFAQPNPAYEVLRQVELGEMPLVVDSIEATLLPSAGAGNTGRLKIVARPATPGAVKRINFNITLSGPLSEVLRLSMDDRLSLGGGAKH